MVGSSAGTPCEIWMREQEEELDLTGVMLRSASSKLLNLNIPLCVYNIQSISAGIGGTKASCWPNFNELVSTWIRLLVVYQRMSKIISTFSMT